VAQQAKVSIHLWHHTRKSNGEGATVDSARGASSFVDACRSVRILETMTKAEAEKWDIQNPRKYFKEFNGKRNFAPSADDSDWFELVSVMLDNGGMFGDDIGVVPNAFASVTGSIGGSWLTNRNFS
jgi:hypothetical protein